MTQKIRRKRKIEATIEKYTLPTCQNHLGNGESFCVLISKI